MILDLGGLPGDGLRAASMSSTRTRHHAKASHLLWKTSYDVRVFSFGRAILEAAPPIAQGASCTTSKARCVTGGRQIVPDVVRRRHLPGSRRQCAVC